MRGTEFNFEEFLSSLNPDELTRFGKQIEDAKKVAAESQATPVKINLSIEIQDSDAVNPAALYSALAKLSNAPVPLTIDEMKALQGIQSELVDWIQASKENAALFAVAPVQALRQSGIKIDEQILEKLEALSPKAFQMGLQDNITFKNVTLTAQHKAQTK